MLRFAQHDMVRGCSRCSTSLPSYPGDHPAHVTLSEAKGLSGCRERCFATLSMTWWRRILQVRGRDASRRSA